MICAYRSARTSAAAIYAWPGGFIYLRRNVIRTYTWLNWLQPLPF
ncbi:MAG TPA: hypothetical protein VE631_07190 [Alphaproteobacteria bacterium]|nr:hypothetical protein [Alphaproteobacteria bacterium]